MRIIWKQYIYVNVCEKFPLGRMVLTTIWLSLLVESECEYVDLKW